MHDSIDVHPIVDSCWDEEWSQNINASEIASIFGVGFKTLAQVVAEKRGLAALGPDPESPLIRRGHALEDDAADEVKKKRPTWKITHNTDHFVDHTHRIGAKPDYFARDPARQGIGVLEIKVVAASVFRREWEEGTTPPLKYLLQLATQMMLVPDAAWGAVVALVIGEFSFDAHIYEVERNRGAESRLRTAAIDFWRTIDAGEHPAIDFERDGALIALMFPAEVPGKIVDLSTDNAIGDLLERRETLKATAKEIEKKLKAAEAEIKMKLGDAEGAIVPGWRVTLKLQNRSGYTVEPTSFRVLRTVRHNQETLP